MTKFLEEHPGGDEVLIESAGKDATKEFDDIGHSKAAKEVLLKYQVGVLQGYSPSEGGKSEIAASKEFNKPKEMKAPSRRSARSSASSTPTSPSRVRSGVINDYLSNGWSILSFGDEVRRGGKAVENRVVDAHTLRLMHNRYLQWRFFNARADVEIAYEKTTREVHAHAAP